MPDSWADYNFIERRGNENENVRMLQNRLIELGYLAGTADGVFESKTQDAIARFQEEHGIFGSKGIATPMTSIRLMADPISKQSFAKVEAPSCAINEIQSFSFYGDSKGTDNIAIELKNDGQDCITGIVVSLYFTGTNGKKLDNSIWWGTREEEIEAGETVRLDFSNQYPNDAEAVWFHIAEIRYADGRIYSNWKWVNEGGFIECRAEDSVSPL